MVSVEAQKLYYVYIMIKSYKMFLVLVTGSNKCSNKNDKKAITFPYFLVTGSRSEDGVPDMTIISNIDEKGINRNLRVRYERDIIYVSQSHIL